MVPPPHWFLPSRQVQAFSWKTQYKNPSPKRYSSNMTSFQIKMGFPFGYHYKIRDALFGKQIDINNGKNGLSLFNALKEDNMKYFSKLFFKHCKLPGNIFWCPTSLRETQQRQLGFGMRIRQENASALSILLPNIQQDNIESHPVEC